MLSSNFWKPLKLIAKDESDLDILIECLFEAIVPTSEMLFDFNKKYFALMVERFTWECAKGMDSNLLQVKSLLVFHNITNVSYVGFNREKNTRELVSNQFLSLFSIIYDKNNILLMFGKGVTIRLDTVLLRCTMEDIGEPKWPAITPRHKKG
tara:strand:- start:205 stop:660 length:456 start_codon:yes stop_codon:yes gene_type:complete